MKPDELNEDERQRICRYATTCASEIANATDIFFQMGDVASIIRKAGPHPPTSRISLTSGEIAFGRFGRSGTALGIPIVQAARMIAKKDFFKTERIISSSQFVTDLKVPITQLPDPLEKNFLIEGSFPINVYPGSI